MSKSCLCWTGKWEERLKGFQIFAFTGDFNVITIACYMVMLKSPWPYQLSKITISMTKSKKNMRNGLLSELKNIWIWANIFHGSRVCFLITPPIPDNISSPIYVIQFNMKNSWITFFELILFMVSLFYS